MRVDPRSLVLVALGGVEGSEDMSTVPPSTLMPPTVTLHRRRLPHIAHAPLSHLHKPPLPPGGGPLIGAGAAAVSLLVRRQVRSPLEGQKGKVECFSTFTQEPVMAME